MTSQISPGDEFVALYNKLDTHLRKITGSSPNLGWQRLVDEVRDRDEIKDHVAELHHYGKLRNSIVHWERYPPELIAVPHLSMLNGFRSLVHEILKPTTVSGKCKSPVRRFSPQDPLRQVIVYMRDRQYSQVVVDCDGEHRLITAEDIARWVEYSIDGDETIDIRSATVLDVLARALPGSSECWEPEKSLLEAREAFARRPEEGRARLWAILVEVGDDGREELGILTPWDLAS